MEISKRFDPVTFQKRREEFLKQIKEKYQQKKGAVILFANFEQEACKFIQESSFYYLTGLNEPAAALVIDFDGKSTLYVPNCSTERAKWVATCVDPNLTNPSEFGVDAIRSLGEPISGYEMPPFFAKEDYSNLLSYIQNVVNDGGSIFTLNSSSQRHYFVQKFILQRIAQFLPSISNSIIDVSYIIAQMRRIKSKKEIELMYKAADITAMGQEAVSQVLKAGKLECEIQAAIEYVFTAAGANLAFPSIVGSGKNSTILHYIDNQKEIKKGELVVVDIGAQYEHYCADLTRTYPVSGKFTKRQREIYDLVLETQQYIESLARPGMWLNNKNHPEESLNHLAREFLKKKGYDKYFPHGIGHYLGLDVHDVGDYSTPLQEGDVITIEPGIYIPEEEIGVRIEDNYWVVADGIVCLSEQLPKTASEIEELMQQSQSE